MNLSLNDDQTAFTFSLIVVQLLLIKYIFSDEIIIIEFRIIWSTVCPHSREIFHFLLYVSIFAVAQSLIHVRLFVSPRTAAFQAPLSSTISWSLLRFMSIESVM